jgi:hypothetical protein
MPPAFTDEAGKEIDIQAPLVGVLEVANVCVFQAG